jgi:hypothetical protein
LRVEFWSYRDINIKLHNLINFINQIKLINSNSLILCWVRIGFSKLVKELSTIGHGLRVSCRVSKIGSDHKTKFCFYYYFIKINLLIIIRRLRSHVGQGRDRREAMGLAYNFAVAVFGVLVIVSVFFRVFTAFALGRSPTHFICCYLVTNV